MNIILYSDGILEYGDPTDRATWANLLLMDMVGFDQLNPHHPEGDLWKHTSQVAALANEFSNDVQIAAIFHDCGKIISWRWNKKNPNHRTFFGHDRIGAEEFKKTVIDDEGSFKAYLLSEGVNLSKVYWLIHNHIRIMQLPSMRETKRLQLENHPWFEELQQLHYCDINGRKP